jgi:hypothetical protein
MLAISPMMSATAPRRPVGRPAALTAARVTASTATGDAKSACITTSGSTTWLKQITARTGWQFDCVSTYNNAAPNWTVWENPWFSHPAPPAEQWLQWLKAAPGTRRLVIGQSMIPTGAMPADWRRRGAAGEYDKYIRTLGRNLVQAELGKSVIRLGFEANGTWNVDSVGQTNADFAQWRAYWARFVRVMRSVPGAHFTFDWNLNSAYRNIPLAKIYPGDQVVDMIGVDVYDEAGPALPAAPSPFRWRAIARQPDGVTALLKFAQKHRKPFSIPEWGLIDSAHRGGGDDPTFIASIAALVRNNTVAFQSYFDHAGVGGVAAIETSPKAFTAYARGFRGR